MATDCIRAITRLNLQILCSFGTPVRKNLTIWPAFPIAIYYPHNFPESGIPPDDEDNVIAALGHRDRLCSIMLFVTDLQLETITKVMQEPFPVLTNLFFSLTLCGILYLALPALLSSTSDLVSLQLYRTPPTSYKLLGAMVACLAALPILADLVIEFESRSATSRNDRISLPPITRILLPALTSFRFDGASEYLEDFVAQIDAPQLKCISVDNILRLVDYRATQLSKFIDRSVGPRLILARRADFDFFGRSITMYPLAKHPSSDWHHAEVLVSLKWVDWPVMDIAQLLSHFPATPSNVIHLNLVAYEANHCLEDISDVGWLQLLYHFSALQTLRLSPALVGNVALALEDITGKLVDELLPSLDLVWIVGQRASSIEKFIATRELYGRPITVVDIVMVMTDSSPMSADKKMSHISCVFYGLVFCDFNYPSAVRRRTIGSNPVELESTEVHIRGESGDKPLFFYYNFDLKSHMFTPVPISLDVNEQVPG
ncbi:hypothetical protein EDB86DRAFT_3085039 [Lactarius hatsudake]|nr:hypothetical protein EDB86DRAFT_3085039 [Lactarius hatsudake]